MLSMTSLHKMERNEISFNFPHCLQLVFARVDGEIVEDDIYWKIFYRFL